MHDETYQSGTDQPDDSSRGNMVRDLDALVCVDRTRLDAFHYLVCETLHGDNLYMAEAESGGVWLAEEGLGERLERLALFARLRSEIEREVATFALSAREVPAFRLFLREVLFAEQEGQSGADLEGDALTVVASGERVELVDSLAEQLGGLF